MREEKNNGKQCRVIKNENYTVVSNIVLRKNDMSLKAKGLLVLCLSLPENWDYTIAGLVTLSSDGRDSVTGALNELEKNGFLYIEKSRIKGTFARFYTFYENPSDNPVYMGVSTVTDFPTRFEDSDRNGFSVTVNPMQLCRNGATVTDNPEQINTNNEIKKENTKNKKKKIKKEEKEKISFGEFKNVFLTQVEIDKLKELYKNEENFNKGVEILSSYKESSGKKYKSDYAVLNKSNWVYSKIFPNVQQLQFAGNNNSGKYSKCYG